MAITAKYARARENGLQRGDARLLAGAQFRTGACTSQESAKLEITRSLVISNVLYFLEGLDSGAGLSVNIYNFANSQLSIIATDPDPLLHPIIKCKVLLSCVTLAALSVFLPAISAPL